MDGTGTKSSQIQLLTRCHVIGRIVSPGFIDLGVKYGDLAAKGGGLLQHDVTIHERKIQVSIGSVSFVAKLYDTKTSDMIYRALPIKNNISMFGQCFYFKSNVETDPENNMSKSEVDIGQLVFWCSEKSIIIPYGPTIISEPGGKPKMLEECNVFGEVDFGYDIGKLFSETPIQNDMEVVLSKREG